MYEQKLSMPLRRENKFTNNNIKEEVSNLKTKEKGRG